MGLKIIHVVTNQRSYKQACLFLDGIHKDYYEGDASALEEEL